MYGAFPGPREQYQLRNPHHREDPKTGKYLEIEFFGACECKKDVRQDIDPGCC